MWSNAALVLNMALSAVATRFWRVYFAFGVIKFYQTSLEVVAVVGLRTRPFARYTPRHCLRTQGPRLDTIEINSRKIPNISRIWQKILSGNWQKWSKFCMLFIFLFYCLWFFGTRNIIRSPSMEKTLQNTEVNLKGWRQYIPLEIWKPITHNATSYLRINES